MQKNASDSQNRVQHNNKICIVGNGRSSWPKSSSVLGAILASAPLVAVCSSRVSSRSSSVATMSGVVSSIKDERRGGRTLGTVRVISKAYCCGVSYVELVRRIVVVEIELGFDFRMTWVNEVEVCKHMRNSCNNAHEGSRHARCVG